MTLRTYERSELNLSVMNLPVVKVPRSGSTRIVRASVKLIPLPENIVQVEEIVCVGFIVKTEDPRNKKSSCLSSLEGITGEMNDVGLSQVINFETSSQHAQETNI